MTTLLHYRIVDQRTRQPVDTLELHVLARAYHAAWQAVHKDSPQGVHHLPKLHTDVEFFRPTRRGGEKGLANNVPSAIQRARKKGQTNDDIRNESIFPELKSLRLTDPLVDRPSPQKGCPAFNWNRENHEY